MAHDTPCRVKSRRETNQKMPVRQSEKRANMCELRAPSFYKTTPPLSIYICRWFYWGVGVGGERGAGAPPALRAATWGGGHVRPRGVSCARPAAFASWYNSRSRTRLPHQATPRITFASNPEKLSCWRLTTYSRKRWRGAYGTAAARNVKFIITELRDRFIGINGVPSKRRSTSARRVGAYYDARSSEWFG